MDNIPKVEVPKFVAAMLDLRPHLTSPAVNMSLEEKMEYVHTSVGDVWYWATIDPINMDILERALLEGYTPEMSGLAVYRVNSDQILLYDNHTDDLIWSKREDYTYKNPRYSYIFEDTFLPRMGIDPTSSLVFTETAIGNLLAELEERDD